jgi:opine dehydrogenase
MTRVAVLGGGAGGLSATVELTQAEHAVALWNRNPQTLEANAAEGVVRFDGVLGTGSVTPRAVTGDLAEAVSDAEVVVVCLPSIAHRRLFEDLAQLRITAPVVLNPGHTGAALEARSVWQQVGAELPPLAELSTLTYVARVHDGVVRTTGRAGTVRVAALPGGDAAETAAGELFPGAKPVADVLASSLSNVNLVLHPPGAVLALAWSEATNGDYTFYREAMTPGVVSVLTALDGERLAVAQAFGHKLPPLIEEMVEIGTVDPDGASAGDVGAAIRGGVANASITGPDSTSHRYYREDFPFGLQPFVALAEVAAVEVPVAGSLLAVATTVLGPEVMQAGRTAGALGIDGMSPSTLLDIVRAE